MNPDFNAPTQQPGIPPLPSQPMTQPPTWQGQGMPKPGRFRNLNLKWLWITLGTFGGLIIILSGTLVWWTTQAKDKYSAAVPGYETRTKDAYNYFGSLKDRLTHGADIKKKFDETIATAPKEPKLLGSSIAPKEKKQRVTELTTAMRTFETTYVNAANISDYSDKTLKIMSTVNGVISTPDDMKAMRTKLQKAKSDIAKQTPPADCKDFQTQTLAAYDAVLLDIDSALSALDKGKTDIYTASVQKLATDVNGVSANTAQKKLATIFNNAYAQADSAYGDLQKALGIEEKNTDN